MKKSEMQIGVAKKNMADRRINYSFTYEKITLMCLDLAMYFTHVISYMQLTVQMNGIYKFAIAVSLNRFTLTFMT